MNLTSAQNIHPMCHLAERTVKYASFNANETDLDRYFVAVGSADKRTDELKGKTQARKAKHSEMQDIYDACSDGSGGSAYLGDGMWITSSGHIEDSGR